mmetsp:Transcript_64471/g.171913  ORF Transcript_64471/g.171913 Transcript_64471/m.171913 type:complete len:265 (-) Transcript_64471:75-869(-)
MKPSNSPYELPRITAGVPRATATACPDWIDFNSPSSPGPTRMSFGHVVLFDHLAAHEFTQFAKPSPAPTAPPAALREWHASWVRTAEYPSLVCPGLHGVAHQSREEVVDALGSGTPPRRWPHVYTGNVMAGRGAKFSPLLPAIPATPVLPLGRALLDDWETEGYRAVGWLLDALSQKSSVKVKERAAIQEHEDAHLDHWTDLLTLRLAKLADPSTVQAAEARVGTQGMRTHLASRAADVVPRAARACQLREGLRAKDEGGVSEP